MTPGKAPGAQPQDFGDDLVSSFFLGPKAQNALVWRDLLARVSDDYFHWRRNYFPDDKSIITRADQRHPDQLDWLDGLSTHLDHVLDVLKADYPFYSPRYIAHMLSDQTLPSVLGLFAGMLYNPNNVTHEAAPVSVKLELEVGDLLADMLGFDKSNPACDDGAWGHLTSGGTIATLEALWVARQAQFVPVMVAHCCRKKPVRARIGRELAERGLSLCKEAKAVIASDVWEKFSTEHLGDPSRPLKNLLAVHPDRQLSLLADLRHALASRLGKIPKEKKTAAELDLTTFVLQAVHSSPYNPARQGYASVLETLNAATKSKSKLQRGVVFASETAHYCLAKACNILGYGSEGLKSIPVDQNFRMRVDVLEERLQNLPADEYVAAVVAIAGTTEEGAVDPVHAVVALRKKTPFWLHLDAAWGGYVACVFDRNTEGEFRRVGARGKLTVRRARRADAGFSGALSVPAEGRLNKRTNANVEWGRQNGPQDHVKQAFGAVREADSVVVDPHKLGYIPYPSGAVVFRNRRTTLLTAQTASYIGAGRREGSDALARGATKELDSVGDYVVEGSKPGAAATAAWLAHTAIPLNQKGHGRVIEDTLVAAQKLARLLTLVDGDPAFHDAWVISAADGAQKTADAHRYCIGFQLVAEPDTNLVTFVARPLRILKTARQETLERVRWTLAELNALNNGIHARMGKPRRDDQVTPRAAAEAAYPYGHPFFVSRTAMRSDRQPDGTYSYASVASLLKDLLPTTADHRARYDGSADGLIAIRCTVMSPYYHLAEAKGVDYIDEFVKTLYGVGLKVLQRFAEQLESYVLVRCKARTAANVAKALRKQRGSVRRAVVITNSDVDEPDRVLLEVRAPLDAETDREEEVRQLGRDHASNGVLGTETLLRTEGQTNGAVDEPVVYMFLHVEVGQTEKVLEKVMSMRISGGGMEARILTGRYDLAVALSGMRVSAAKKVVEKIRQMAYVIPPSDVFWSKSK